MIRKFKLYHHSLWYPKNENDISMIEFFKQMTNLIVIHTVTKEYKLVDGNNNVFFHTWNNVFLYDTCIKKILKFEQNDDLQLHTFIRYLIKKYYKLNLNSVTCIEWNINGKKI